MREPMPDKHIIDNRAATLADRLRERLRPDDSFSLVSAYFSIYGFQTLADELESLESVRFLYGDPASVDDPDPGARDPKSFSLTEQGLQPRHALSQKALARRCADWVKRDSVRIRSVARSNFLHGKMYLTESPSGDRSGVVGSSNFTRGGLGGGSRPNLEINLAVSDADALSELAGWFDDLWNDEGLTADVKQDVLNALNRIGADYAPEFIYYKTLYELFRDEIERRQRDDGRIEDTHLYESEIWKALYEFQKDGAKSVISRLRRHNGCILADSVGLGKTYTALAVIKHYEANNARVLVLCPRKLRENWALYQAHAMRRDNPFVKDRFGYTLLSHTDLSRETGMVGDIDLANFNWGGFDLVVIDESHNFRNMGGARYQRLLDEIIKQGASTKVLMLSATPVNTSLTDLRNQIYLITEGREDDFRQSLGVSNIGGLLATAQRSFRDWETAATPGGRRDKTKLLETLGPGFMRLLEGLSISRSRRQIERFYQQEMERIGQFPNHAEPVNIHPPTDLSGSLSYQALADRIGEFALSIYRPTDYLSDESRRRELDEEREARNFNQSDRERFLIGMMRVNFLKRLESSAHSLTLTLDRTIAKIDDLLAKIERYEANELSAVESDASDALPDDDEDDEEFYVNRGRNPYRLSELDLPAWKADLIQDAKTLKGARDEVAAITPERDGKLKEIARAIRDRADNPTTDRDGKLNRKTLVFTTFKDTALYLYNNLRGLAAELNLNIAMVSGDETRAGFGDNDFNSILSNFAPVARNRPKDMKGEIDLLIATDCISEGQNLQDCDTVLNYDIHWNPVRVIQRFGRIDRIGSRSRSVRMINYWPTPDMETYLRLQNRVLARMALADISATGDDDPFTEDKAQGELKFRDEQLLRLREEILDLDDLSDGVVMSDFTLDYFFTQLLRYLEKNREELEAAPNGAYAVAPTGGGSHPGVIFFLRQRNAASDPGQTVASPVHPYYIVYIHDSGDIRYGCANARQTLEVFESAAVGNDKPITALCDRFDAETGHGGDMTLYDLLLDSVIDHVRRAHSRTQMAGLRPGAGRDFKLTPASQSPRDANDFDLVTWLVMYPAG